MRDAIQKVNAGLESSIFITSENGAVVFSSSSDNNICATFERQWL